MFRCLFIISIAVFCFSCSDNNHAQVPTVVARDTTIKPSTAYTLLKLDSNSVEHFINSSSKEKNIVPRIRNFYNSRNYQYAWFDEQGLTEHGEAFWNLHQMQIEEDHDTSVSAKRLHDHMQVLLNEDTSGLTGHALQTTELDLTLHFFKYVATAFNAKVQPEQMQWNIPLRKINPQAMLDSFLTSKEGEWKPLNQSFYWLQSKLQQYASIAKAGGWPTIAMKKEELKPGTTDSLIVRIKKRN